MNRGFNKFIWVREAVDVADYVKTVAVAAFLETVAFNHAVSSDLINHG